MPMDPRARALLREAEIQAERTIARARVVASLILIVMLWLTVVSVVPEDNVALGRQVDFAQYTTGAYLIVAVLSLGLASKGQVSLRTAWVFATCDIAFLAANVVATLDNYGLSPEYIMTLPPVWLIPLLLAFGTLRYNPALQLYMTIGLLVILSVGILAVPGWTYSTDREPPPEVVWFFDFPPNVMRVAMIAMAGMILVLAVARSRALLLHALEENRQRLYLTRYLPPQIADWLTGEGSAEARRGRRQQAAILFVDIRGFTSLAEDMDPEDLSRLLSRFRTHVSRAAEQFDGLVDKFIGDGALLVFGIPTPQPQDAANAVSCGRAIVDAIDAWNREGTGREIRLGIGVHYGAVYCGTLGDAQRLEFTVLGDAVNVASRVEQLTKTLNHRMIITGDVLQATDATAGAAAWADLGEHALRGRDRGVRLFGLAEAEPVRTVAAHEPPPAIG